MKFATKAIHAGVHPDPATGAIMTPIYQTSTYVQTSPGKNQGFEYSRTHNPTRSQLQNAVAALDNGKHGLAFATGMAAIDCVMKLLKPGDEVISTNDLYGGSYRLFTKVYEPYGIKFHFVPMHDMAAVRAMVSEKTKLIWVETPPIRCSISSILPPPLPWPRKPARCWPLITRSARPTCKPPWIWGPTS